mgnify:CR=1 FL=1
MAIMSQRQGLGFDTGIVSDTRNVNHIVTGMLDMFGEGIRFLRDPTRGGLASVLNEVAGQTTHGLSIRQADIPIDEEVEGACEMLGLDPLLVANEGKLIAIVPPAAADDVLDAMRTHEHGRRAVRLGRIGAEHPRIVVMKTAIGGTRVIPMPIDEVLPRIC